MSESWIPKLVDTSRKAAINWLTTMHGKGLLFCLDEQTEQITTIADGTCLFSKEEVQEVDAALDALFKTYGNCLHDLAFDVVSKTFHTRKERSQFKAMYG